MQHSMAILPLMLQDVPCHHSALFSLRFHLLCRYKPAPEDQLLKAFQVLDQESKGNLSKEELTKYMTEEGKCLRYTYYL